MKNKIKIKILDDDHFVLRRLYSCHVNIYNIDYTPNGTIYTIDIEDLEKVPFDINIISFFGIKSLIYHIKKHKHFFISIFISIAMIIISSHMIISVEVIHNDKKIRELIEDSLYDNGIHPFMFKKSYSELQKIKDKIRASYKENIEWLEIIDEGMKYTVRVEERIITKKEEIPNYCDIVSTKDAIVLSSKVTSGQEVVDYNDFVKKGSTLVSGKVLFNEQTKNYVCANATVYGNTWYTVNVSSPLEHEVKNYTGRHSTNISFLYGSKRAPILKVHFENYDIEKKVLLQIGRLTIYREKNLEYISTKEKYSYDEAYKNAILMGREKMKVNLPSTATILDEKVLQTNSYDSIIEMDIFYSVKEIISKQVEKDIQEEEGKLDEFTR